MPTGRRIQPRRGLWGRLAGLEAGSRGDKVGTSAEVIQILRDKGATRDCAKDLVARLVIDGKWEQWRAPVKNAATYVGPPDGIKKKRAEVADKLQKKLAV